MENKQPKFKKQKREVPTSAVDGPLVSSKW